TRDVVERRVAGRRAAGHGVPIELQLIVSQEVGAQVLRQEIKTKRGGAGIAEVKGLSAGQLQNFTSGEWTGRRGDDLGVHRSRPRLNAGARGQRAKPGAASLEIAENHVRQNR